MRVTDNEYADPAVNEPKVTDPPEAIWLVYGDLEHDDTHANCCASGEVTWCEDAQFPADVRYLRADLLYREARVIAAEEVAAERDRCAAACNTAAMEYDACASSPLATEHGREWHRRAAEWARAMAAALMA